MRFWSKLGLLALTALGALPAQANGGAYNGPDLKGISVPASLDRVVTLADVENAYQFCASSMAVKVWEQVHKRSYQGAGKVTGKFSYKWADSHMTFGYEGKLSDTATETQPLMIVKFESWQFLAPMFVTLPDAPAGSYPDDIHLGVSLMSRLKFDSDVRDGAYDELGRLVNGGQIIATQLSFDQVNWSLPDWDFGNRVPLQNEDGGGTSKVTVNMNEWDTCLKTMVQL